MTRNEQIQYIQSALTPFCNASAGDPHYLTAVGLSPAVRLEHASVSGGKYWEGKATDQHLIVTWGKVNGSQGASKTLQRNQCKADNTVMELMQRATKKLQEGYHLISCENATP